MTWGEAEAAKVEDGLGGERATPAGMAGFSGRLHQNTHMFGPFGCQGGSGRTRTAAMILYPGDGE